MLRARKPVLDDKPVRNLKPAVPVQRKKRATSAPAFKSRIVNNPEFARDLLGRDLIKAFADLPASVRELKAMSNPPAAVKQLCQGLLDLFAGCPYFPELKAPDASGRPHPYSDSEAYLLVKKMMASPNQFVERLEDFVLEWWRMRVKYGQVHYANFPHAGARLFGLEDISGKSLAAQKLLAICHCLLRVSVEEPGEQASPDRQQEKLQKQASLREKQAELQVLLQRKQTLEAECQFIEVAQDQQQQFYQVRM